MMQPERTRVYPWRVAMDGTGAKVAQISTTCGILWAQC